MVLRVTTKPIGSFHFILTLQILFLLFYVILMPAFEGADEPEHLRYIEAVFKGEKVHPVDRANPRRYGIEVYQPPLYYHMAAIAARLFPVVFPNHLAINPDKNPHRPYLVHDHPGEVFPFDPARKTLRYFRTLSLLLGIVSFILFAQMLHLVMPENPQCAGIILLLATLWPNNLQVFSVVSNDSLVYLFNLTLILALLHTLKADRPSWKHGLLIGATLALGILSKMTILFTIAAFFPVFVFDLILDRNRVRVYLKMLPAVLLPILLLAGPFVISMTIWYESPTGEGLHNLLVPGVIRQATLSCAAVFHAMARILPRCFLADLCWQQLTLPFVSPQLFMLWFSLNIIMAIRMALPGFRKLTRQEILHRVLVLSSFAFMFIGLYCISTNYIHMQIRHVWNLWPITLLAPYFAIKNLKCLQYVNRKTILSIVFASLMIILISANFLILYKYVIMYKPREGVSRPDLDYFIFSDNFAQSPQKASEYLNSTNLHNVTSYNELIQTDDRHNVLHASLALGKRPNKHEYRLMCVRALRSLGSHIEALEVLRKGEDDSHGTRLLKLGILVDLGRFREARELIGRSLPEAPPDVRVQLESILKKIADKNQSLTKDL